MKNKHKIRVISQIGIGLTALTLLLAGCSGGSSSSANNNTVSGVATPSKVSVVNTN